MDDMSFDRLTLRLGRLSSRRAALGGLGLAALAISDLTEAKRNRKKKRKKNKKKPCRPESPATTCVWLCGAVQNNCHQAIECLPCPSGQFCLTNASCATHCEPNGDDCPTEGCSCPSYPSTEGAHFCGVIGAYCLDNPQVCEGTSECPLGSVCQLFGCGQGGTLEGRCWPLCNA